MAFRIEEEIGTMRVRGAEPIMMTPKLYQELAMRTKGNEFTDRELMLNAALGLCGETTEFSYTLSREFRNNSDEENKKELGDIEWYVALMCDVCKIDIEGIFNDTHKVDFETKTSMCYLAGELADYFKKVYFQGHELEKVIISNYLKHMQSLIEKVCYIKEYDIQEIWQMNIDKLKKRYPDGFEVERSVNREVK